MWATLIPVMEAVGVAALTGIGTGVAAYKVHGDMNLAIASALGAFAGKLMPQNITQSFLAAATPTSPPAEPPAVH